MEQLLTARQAAECLQVTQNVMAKWRLRGGGPEYVKLGSLVRYSPEALRAYVEARRMSSTSTQPHEKD